MNKKIYLIFIILIVAVLCLYLLILYSGQKSTLESSSSPDIDVNPNKNQPKNILSVKINPPIDNAAERITKKPFGTYVAPGRSPIEPERFLGYHTGVDFETYASEKNIDVPISAICSGHLLLKKIAQGYGGVAVQQCKIDNQDVTVIYGHLKYASIIFNVGDEIIAGQELALLGKGESSENDGERKHLHLGIHRGLIIDLRGYAQNQAELESWLDAKKYL